MSAQPDDYSWSLNPIDDALVIELFAAALGEWEGER